MSNKRKLAALLIIISAFTLAACSGSGSGDDSNTNALINGITEEEQPVYTISEPLPVGDFYSITASREDSNLYKVIGEDVYIITKYCYEYVYYDSAKLYGANSIIFEDSSTCDVDSVVGLTSLSPGNYSVSVSMELSNWYALQAPYSGQYLKTSYCYEYVYYDNATFSVSYLNPYVIYFQNGNDCDALGYYYPLNL